MKTLLTIASFVILSGVVWGQSTTDTTTINHSDGSRTIVKCSDTAPNSTNCSVRNTVLPEWTAGGFKDRKENIARGKFCKAQHIKPYLGAPPVLNPDCATAWEQHKASVNQ